MKRIRNNKGFTLAEMLIVMVITMILISILLVSFNTINNANLRKSARRLENVIRLARTKSMAKGTAAGKLYLYEQNGNLYARIGDTDQPELICNGGITVWAAATNNYSLRPAQYNTPDLGFGSVGGYPGKTISFSTSGVVQTFSADPVVNKFIMFKGTTKYEIILYRETGSVETRMF